MNIIEVIRECVAKGGVANEYSVEEYSEKEPSLAGSSTSNYSELTENKALTQHILADEPPIHCQLLQIYYRIWLSLSKMLKLQVLQGNCLVWLDFGYFFLSARKNSRLSGHNADLSDNLTKCCFSPTVDLLEKHKLRLQEDEWNINPSQRQVLDCAKLLGGPQQGLRKSYGTCSSF